MEWDLHPPHPPALSPYLRIAALAVALAPAVGFGTRARTTKVPTGWLVITASNCIYMPSKPSPRPYPTAVYLTFSVPKLPSPNQ
jgi:hypothetical protein